MTSYRNNLKFLIFTAKLAYLRYNAYVFILYMLKRFSELEKLKKRFKVLPISYENFLIKAGQNYLLSDVNNTILVNTGLVESPFATIKVKQKDVVFTRKVHVVTANLESANYILISYNLWTNLKQVEECIVMEYHETVLQFADEIGLSLINTSHDWNNYIIDTVLKNYFALPKLVYPGDLIEINLRQYGSEIVYFDNKIVNVFDNIHMKCNKIVFQEKEVDSGYYSLFGKTTVTQSVNSQSFIETRLPCDQNLVGSYLCPGLKDYFDKMKNSFYPFIKYQKKIHLNPVFLIQGRKGSGKHLLVNYLTSYFGMHLYTVNSFDIAANVYAQNETKLKNVFFTAKLSAPCILEIKNFENFSKNNEGQYDERLINHFSKELKNLLSNNEYPVIIVCSSNEKDIPLELKRLFLRTFEIKAPNEKEREQILQWILETNNIQANANLNDIANKTHGFIFEDLNALFHYAITDHKNSRHLNDQVFSKALDFMQLNYNESMGAPKVPKVLWSDIGGLEDVKQEIIKTVKLPLAHPEILKSTGLKRSGILLFGPPGTGKTLIAKAVATECGLCFLSVKGPELLNMYVGQSEKNVREVFERAREASPCIIFFDELDSLAPNRGASGDSGGVMDRVVSQILAEMDGLEESGTVFVIGATNRPDLIDPALLRPGRFDKLLYIGPCTDRYTKLCVLTALTRKFKLASDRILDTVVDLCPNNFSGADFYGACSNAWMYAVKRLITRIENGNLQGEICSEEVIVCFEDFQLGIKDVKPSIRTEDLDYFTKLKSELT